jgi:hypothetical protein
MRSFTDQERENQDDAFFDEATNKTPDAVRKHHSNKLPPPLPSTILELAQLLWRFIALTEGLFTSTCSLASQLRDLHKELQEQEQHLMGYPDAAADLIPQLTWAIIVGARQFFGTIYTREDVDPVVYGNVNQPRAKLAVANLSIHTQMFSAGYKLQLITVPSQWTQKATKVQAERQSDATGGHGTQDQRSDDPFPHNARDEGTSKGTNPKYPKIFSTSTKLQDVRNKFRGITLNEIIREAGVREGTSGLDTTGLVARPCMTWICMGQCHRPACTYNHPDTVSDAAAEALYKQIEGGLTRILESGKRPKF